MLALFKENMPTRTLWACIFVISLGVLVQLAPEGLKAFVAIRKPASTPTEVTITMSPEPELFYLFMPVGGGGKLKTKPLLWLSNGDEKCNPHSPTFDPTYSACLIFTKSFTLLGQQSINVSVEGALSEMRDRLLKLESTNQQQVVTEILSER